MNKNIIGGTVKAYKHKDYGDVFLYLKSTPVGDYFDITDKMPFAIYNYHENFDLFNDMLEDLQEEHVYLTLHKNYTDEDGYVGELKKVIPLQLKDFVEIEFNADYRYV